MKSTNPTLPKKSLWSSFRKASRQTVFNWRGAMIAVLYSEETDAWGGKELTIYPTMWSSRAEVRSIRIKGPKPKLRDVESA